MVTNIKRSGLEKVIAEENFNYPYTSLIADKLRAIYSLFGWSHMLEDFSGAHDTIEELTMYVYKELAKGAKESNVTTAGLKIEGWFDEDDILNLDYYFSLE